MISTEQWSLFTIACPMPECFVGEGEKGKQKTVNRTTSGTKKRKKARRPLVRLVGWLEWFR